ncbi:MAG: SusC/RagA family TonB-linked outer membrane protein, partial [Candidatus Cryptobacteroides sp.]
MNKLAISFAVVIFSVMLPMRLTADPFYGAQQSTLGQTQQEVTITGTVLDETGQPVIGATVLVKESSIWTTTDEKGQFKFNAPAGSVLVISYLGYQTAEVQENGTILTVNLIPDEHLLEESVVTALGIRRSEKALSYNVQQVDNEELTTVKNTNFMNSLAGKVAGVNINASSAGLGGATRVVMRGPKSISQSNQALYVVDGVPINNRNNGDVSGIFTDQPGGEGISDFNPEDIESISVLSGPAAAALYGSAAAQGVIMITTKQGKEGKVSVTISNSTQFSNPLMMPDFQNVYPNRPGEVSSWGEPGTSEYTGYDPKNFFNTAVDIQNNVSLTVGNEKNQTYASVGTTNANGIIPNNSYQRYNFSFRNKTSFLKDKLIIDAGFQYVKQKDCNLMAQGQYYNPLVSLYLFPRGESFDAIRTFEIWDQSRGIYVQNWNYGNALQMQNPYWVANRMNRTNDKNRYMLNASLKYQILDWLDITGRIRFDRADTKAEDKRYASTINLFAHSDYGFYKYHNITDQNLYGDLMLNINKKVGQFSIGANIGISMSRTMYDDEGFQGGLKAPSNIFTPNAIDYGSPTNDNRPIYEYTRH